jgi:uncharacterized protein (DUF924 family)
MPSYAGLFNFWFGSQPCARPEWFRKDASFDQIIRSQFVPLLKQWPSPELLSWKADLRGIVSLVILFDQVPRNAFRDQPESFAYDQIALDLAREAVESGRTWQVAFFESFFLILPFEHSETLADQKESVRLFEHLAKSAPTDRVADAENALSYATQHRDIIQRFGRFPHRNGALGRTSTAEEISFLTQPGSSF